MAHETGRFVMARDFLWVGAMPLLPTLSLDALSAFVLGVAMGALVIPCALLVRMALRRAHPSGGGAQLAGRLARVTTAIPIEGVGRVVARRAGARVVMPARACDAIAIDHGVAVVLVSVERGVAWVTPFDLCTIDLSNPDLEREDSRSESEVPWIR
jgi:hypothetical protein